eukprot:3233381-Prorocentrum_lima.AAC.1
MDQAEDPLPPVKTPRMDDVISNNSGSAQTSLAGAPPWAEALYSQMTLMLNRQKDLSKGIRD